VSGNPERARRVAKGAVLMQIDERTNNTPDEPSATPQRRIVLANPRGFCAGVDRAIETVDALLEIYGAPVYVRKEIVHNRAVVDGFRANGVIFVEEVGEVPDGSVLVFSAHGISPEVRREARERRLTVVDATCPLVTKVHLEALRYAAEGCFLLLVGHANHDEIVGTLGHVPGGIALVENLHDAQTVGVPDEERVALITQTTLGVDDTRDIIATLRTRFPALREPARSDICYATTNRQSAVKELAKVASVVVVVGSQSSSNSQRLRDIAAQAGSAAYMVDGEDQLQAAWFAQAETIGVTAGASSPETLVRQIVERIAEQCGSATFEEIGQPEPAIVFAPPRELIDLQAARSMTAQA
jgi:4-hydroxy-3-methylbut-2-enyl diphosphate reductase